MNSQNTEKISYLFSGMISTFANVSFFVQLVLCPAIRLLIDLIESQTQ